MSNNHTIMCYKWLSGNNGYLLIIHLMMLSAAHTMKHQMIGWLVNNELEKMLKGAVIPEELPSHLPGVTQAKYLTG
jgi:hypothetical protein